MKSCKATPSLHKFGLQLIFNFFVASLIFYGLQLALKELSHKHKGLGLCPKWDKIERKKIERKYVVGLLKFFSLFHFSFTWCDDFTALCGLVDFEDLMMLVEGWSWM